MNYYNDNSPEICAWLKELIAAKLIPNGHVDGRSISEVEPDDLSGFTQCHLFAGIAGWSYALQLAGWPEDQPVWTGSCPCQPFSCAGNQLGNADPRHLWPKFYRLIVKCRPSIVFGEQVASKAGRLWLAGVRKDLENAAYAVGAARLPALAVGAKHFRYRFYFVADALCKGLEGLHQAGGKIGLQPTPGDVPRHNWKATPRVLTRIDGVSPKLDRPPFYRAQVEGFGNAIVPLIASEFIRSFVEAIEGVNVA